MAITHIDKDQALVPETSISDVRFTTGYGYYKNKRKVTNKALAALKGLGITTLADLKNVWNRNRLQNYKGISYDVANALVSAANIAKVPLLKGVWPDKVTVTLDDSVVSELMEFCDAVGVKAETAINKAVTHLISDIKSGELVTAVKISLRHEKEKAMERLQDQMDKLNASINEASA